MKYRWLLLTIYPLLLNGMDESSLKKRFSVSHKNTDHQNPAKVAQGELIESYREGGKELFREKSDKLAKILQENGISANTVARISLRIEANKFQIFSPRNTKLETILNDEKVHSDAVSAIVQEVKTEETCQEMEIDHDE
jgi:hypothetical protein